MRTLKHWWQRRTRGFDDSDTWNLDFVIAEFALPRVKRFLELTIDENCVAGHPGGISHEEWIKILEQIIWSLDWIAREYNLELPDEEMEFKGIKEEKIRSYKIQEGLSLFGKHFINLGW